MIFYVVLRFVMSDDGAAPREQSIPIPRNQNTRAVVTTPLASDHALASPVKSTPLQIGCVSMDFRNMSRAETAAEAIGSLAVNSRSTRGCRSRAPRGGPDGLHLECDSPTS